MMVLSRSFSTPDRQRVNPLLRDASEIKSAGVGVFMKRLLLIGLSALLLGAASNDSPPSIPNDQPDIEMATNSPFDEEAGQELSIDQQPNQSTWPTENPYDPTQGQVDQ